jgi:hypothetical protein
MGAEVTRRVILLAGAMFAGSAWLWGGTTLAGPALSLTLLLWVALGRSALERFLVALAYYLTGCWPIVGAVLGYWGVQHLGVALTAWWAAALVLATPWTLPPRWGGLLAALLLTALPPLGVIGWLSPLNAVGVLFPATGWIGLLAMLILAGVLPLALRNEGGARHALLPLLVMVVLANAIALVKPAAGLDMTIPQGWVGIQTRIKPDDGSVPAGIANNQAVIAAGLDQGRGARVVVFPEAILPDWYDGTRVQFASAVPPGQVWLLGVQTGGRDAVVEVRTGRAVKLPRATAAGLLLGGDWQPWNPRTLHPTWWQKAFELDGQRVWAALCVEQVQPWTWLEAMWQQPTVILAQSNAWWSHRSPAAPKIQAACTRAWTRLMGVPVVTSVND